MRAALVLAAAALVFGGCASLLRGGGAASPDPEDLLALEVQVEEGAAALGVPCPVRVRIRNDSPARTFLVAVGNPPFSVVFEPGPDPGVALRNTGGPWWANGGIIEPRLLRPGEVKELRTFLDYVIRLDGPGEARLRCTARFWAEEVPKADGEHLRHPDREVVVSLDVAIRVNRLSAEERRRRLRPYREALDSDEEGERVQAAFLLACLAGNGDRALAEELAAHPCSEVRKMAVAALEASRAEWADARIKDLVHDPDPGVAASALCALCFDRVVLLPEEDLRRVLARPEEEVRAWLVDYLDATHHPLRGPFLARLLEDPSEEVRARAGQVLSEDGGE